MLYLLLKSEISVFFLGGGRHKNRFSSGVTLFEILIPFLIEIKSQGLVIILIHLPRDIHTTASEDSYKFPYFLSELSQEQRNMLIK